MVLKILVLTNSMKSVLQKIVLKIQKISVLNFSVKKY